MPNNIDNNAAESATTTAATNIVLYNTLSRQKEVFVPKNPENVGMYVCGPTVYDFAHIGNARPVVVFDVLSRLLRLFYPKVTYVRNITDVDDKINMAAKLNGESITDLTQRTAQAYHEDTAALNALSPDLEPRATHHIDDMITMILGLIDKGHAYAAEGHVLFRVASYGDYGTLSGRHLDEMLAGARVEVAPYKQDPCDFVLWKPSDDETPGWESPWGRGRPGWHIECSAMSWKYLGDIFDIHGGGQDLIFPHHENEVAQSRCFHGTPVFARYWLHNGHLTVNGEKMSKSLGNFFTVRDLLAQYPGEVLRYGLLSAHYRQPLDWTDQTMRQAKQALDRFYLVLRHEKGLKIDSVTLDPVVLKALTDDLNVPLALTRLHELATLYNKADGYETRRHIAATLKKAGALLGILQTPPEHWFKGADETPEGCLTAADIHQMLDQRQQARAQKDFAESDRIRDVLLDQGIILEDSPKGTTWRRV